MDKYDAVDDEVIAIMEKRRFSDQSIDENDLKIMYKKEEALAHSKLKGLSPIRKFWIYLYYGISCK